MGKVKNYAFFRNHALRKFHTTTIEDTNLTNTLQGRKPDSITFAYFKQNPKRIKEKYIKYLPKLTIQETKVNIMNDKGYKELEKLKKEIKLKDEKFEKYKQEQEEKLIKFLKNDYGNYYTYKVWIWSGLDKTRHSQMDNETVEINDKFTVINEKTGETDYLDYPCDIENYTNPSNIINCACNVEYIKK